MGLSPRVRGNHGGSDGPAHIHRSIPACAGEPWSSECWSGNATVYPRVCGGTSGQYPHHVAYAGLSPRVRGNHFSCFLVDHRGGSIPACAGEPRVFQPKGCKRTVYPRVCGGTPPTTVSLVDMLGLSPRVRGNRPGALADLLTAGSIPACAGEPPMHARRIALGRVYPRVCGGTVGRTISITSRRGLSPRVRGNPSIVQYSDADERSIPSMTSNPASSSA